MSETWVVGLILGTSVDALNEKLPDECILVCFP